MLRPNILVLNPGSSTLKYARFHGGECVDSSTLEWLESPSSERDPDAASTSNRVDGIDYSSSVRALIARSDQSIDAVAFRVVHGGMFFTAPTLIDEQVLQQLEGTIDLAPLHQPPAIAAMRAAQSELPSVMQIACFDTAFHATLPEVEKRFAIADAYYQSGIRRYGFHGLSYESISLSLPSCSSRAAAGKTVVCHLGNGASVCGMFGGESRTTTMGLTPLDGLIMGTRSGRIDAGIPIHWMRQGMEADRIETILTKESGLLGLSGRSSDMRQIVDAIESDPACALALDMFCRSVAKEVASAATAMGGIDAIVFTAGIGEHSSTARARIIQYLEWIGAKIDPQANDEHRVVLHTASSSTEILCIATDEQQVIARHAMRLLESHRARGNA